jgi:NifU-like protein involved in Fe-S cluster formation
MPQGFDVYPSIFLFSTFSANLAAESVVNLSLNHVLHITVLRIINFMTDEYHVKRLLRNQNIHSAGLKMTLTADRDQCNTYRCIAGQLGIE